jgi:hypothetical protein
MKHIAEKDKLRYILFRINESLNAISSKTGIKNRFANHKLKRLKLIGLRLITKFIRINPVSVDKTKKLNSKLIPNSIKNLVNFSPDELKEYSDSSGETKNLSISFNRFIATMV